MSIDSRDKEARHRRSEHPHPVDIHVGSRLRQRRQLLGLSQEKLGEAIGRHLKELLKLSPAEIRAARERKFAAMGSAFLTSSPPSLR